MNEVLQDYKLLLEQFINGMIVTEQLQDIYLNRFKNEKRAMDGPLYDVLEELFGDLDSYTIDPYLLAEDPDFYLDEVGLRQKIRQGLKRLADLQRE
jgi:hypothetical protein